MSYLDDSSLVGGTLEYKLKQIFERHNIGLIFDVGANDGYYANTMRKRVGFSGRIVSFEPTMDSFCRLQHNAKDDDKWICQNVALGDEDEKQFIHLSANSLLSSSILTCSEVTKTFAPGIAAVGIEGVTVRKLDSIFDEFALPEDQIFMKVDVQGYEKNVIMGAMNVLDRIPFIQLELATYRVYDEEPTMGEMLPFMEELGYRVIDIERGWGHHNTYEMFEADFLFSRLPVGVSAR